MKLSVDRLKSIDWKQFGVNHGEKIALGFVGLMVVMILFLGTRWKTFQEKQPDELVSQVEKEQQALSAATWPEAEQEIYNKRYDVRTVYDNTYSVVRADDFKYDIGHPMVWPLHRQQEPVEEPQWLAVQELIATPGVFVLELPPPGEEPILDATDTLVADAAANAKSKEEAMKAQFGLGRGPSQGGLGGEDGGPGGYDRGPMPTGELPEGRGPAGRGPGRRASGSEPFTGERPSGPTGEYQYTDADMDGGMGEMGTETIVNCRGVRYVAVRGVFPLREQADKIMNAQHNPLPLNPRNLVWFKDFELQRQKAKPGPSAWSDDDKDWQTVDPTLSFEVLTEAADYADDVVDINETHYVFTMPLPMRLTGRWTPYFVGHPKIKTLTEKEKEFRRVLNEQLVQLKQQADEAGDESDAPAGFARITRDMAGIQNEVYGDTSLQQRLMRNVQQMYDPDNKGFFKEQGYEGMMAGMMTETPKYLLFRYLDFDVEPGQAYRYRVRLKMYNPNHDQPLENVASPKVVDGKYRETPWSKPTGGESGIVPEDAKFFVQDITPPRGPNEAKAKVDFFQWLSEVGTTAHKVLEVKVGQIIGQPKPKTTVDEITGKEELADNKDEDKQVEVLRPYQSFKPEPAELATQDAVVDLVAPPRTFQNRDFHADLKIKDLQPEWQGVVKPVSQMLVVNQYGELENRNPLAQYKQHNLAKTYLDLEYRDWEYLKQAAQTEEMGEDGMEGMEGDAGQFYEYDYGEGGGRGKSRRGGSGRGGSAGRGGGRGGSRVNPLRRRGRGPVDS